MRHRKRRNWRCCHSRRGSKEWRCTLGRIGRRIASRHARSSTWHKRRSRRLSVAAGWHGGRQWRWSHRTRRCGLDSPIGRIHLRNRVGMVRIRSCRHIHGSRLHSHGHRRHRRRHQWRHPLLRNIGSTLGRKFVMTQYSMPDRRRRHLRRMRMLSRHGRSVRSSS
jgi:hypothetical protein